MKRYVAAAVGLLILGGVALWWLADPLSGPPPTSVNSTRPVTPGPRERRGPAGAEARLPTTVAAQVPDQPDGVGTHGEDVCPDLDTLQQVVMQDGIDDGRRGCLEQLALEGSDAEKALRLLSVISWDEDRDAWVRYSLQLASITEDPDLHLKLALHYAKVEQPDAALHHTQVAMSQSHRWDDARRDARMSTLDKLSAKLCTVVDDPEACD